MASISTRRGDDGSTGRPGGERTSKGDLRVEASGCIDELNTTIGVARAFCDDPQIAAIARSIQRELFAIGSAVSTKPDARRPIPTIEKALVTRLDEIVATLEAEPGILRDWSISGEYRGSAAFDLARTVARRAERNTVRLVTAGEKIQPTVLAYLNRVSDVLWLCARVVEARAGVDARLRDEQHPRTALVARLVSRRARALMILGTASDVGKSLVTAALCRIFADRGVDVAPFKAQNMSLEAAVTPEGHEIGRAQALQAEAARRPAHVDMNPILIKPTGERRAQVIVDGTIWDDVDAWDYHKRRTAELFPRVVAAYERLAARCELVVLEGAGSPAEINLRAGDIVNMRMAAAADAPCILVVDIDRGGAFAALVGTLALLEDDERARIRGFVVNKFRGDVALLTPGIVTIEERTGLPCFGIVPWLDDLGLEQEDGYVARRTSTAWPGDGAGPERRLRVAVVRYPQGANLSDVDALAAEPSVALRSVDDPTALADADVVILPGSKATLADLAWMRERGLADAVCAHAAAGRFVFGLCGGMQMLGTSIADPLGMEGGGEAPGLGLLPLTTTFGATKVVRRVSGTARGYEIHVGVSDGDASAADGRIVGTYVHGVLDDDAHRHGVIAGWRRRCGLMPAGAWSDYTAARDRRLDRWSAHVAAHLDVDAIAALA